MVPQGTITISCMAQSIILENFFLLLSCSRMLKAWWYYLLFYIPHQHCWHVVYLALLLELETKFGWLHTASMISVEKIDYFVWLLLCFHSSMMISKNIAPLSQCQSEIRVQWNWSLWLNAYQLLFFKAFVLRATW